MHYQNVKLALDLLNLYAEREGTTPQAIWACLDKSYIHEYEQAQVNKALEEQATQQTIETQSGTERT